ncbi:hypothetical protein AB0H71_30800 [Nocardia sp. NPDC050697]|uniref:hypothetical protein n=1 Tax=Nocardia sp. NPDC050697 TaxID=3155158 RepID=UPI0033EDDF95
MIVVGDTSGLVAAFSLADAEHSNACVALQQAALTVVSPLVMLEIEYITTRCINRRSTDAVDDWLLAQGRAGRLEMPAARRSLTAVEPVRRGRPRSGSSTMDRAARNHGSSKVGEQYIQ